jgi:ABC-type multidrug transport system ATPase subunit
MNTLSIQNLSLVYNNHTKAINEVSLQINNGMFGLLGPNGAGKSSLMKTIVGLQKPTSGSIFFNGVEITADPAFLKKQLGFLPQDFGVYPKASAAQLLDHLALLKGVTDKKERKNQIEQLLHKVNLYEYRNKEVFTYSGGMKQRFGVAQTLLGNPKLIIVDEPTAGLDPEERNRFNTLLTEISEEIIVLLSTHLVEDVRNLCSNMAVMKKGTLLSTGQPAQLMTTMKNKVWTKFIDKNELPGYELQYQVIIKQFVEKKLLITVVSEDAPAGFDTTIPTLEHFYFYTLTKNN